MAKDCFLVLAKHEAVSFKYSHFVPLMEFKNNFDFYCSSGSYHPPAIEEYFNETVQPHVENKISFRSWSC